MHSSARSIVIATLVGLIHTSPFYELTALVVLAAVLGFAGLLLRQPMVVSFIAVGVLAGPSALNLVQSHENIKLLAELGVAVLLFWVGLKLDLKASVLTGDDLLPKTKLLSLENDTPEGKQLDPCIPLDVRYGELRPVA